MQTRIHSQGFTLTDSIQTQVERQVSRNLRRHDRDIIALDVYLSDINGPRGGDDMKVVMRASLGGLPPVSVSTEHGDLYVAISRGARRLQRAVKRVIRKSRRLAPRRIIDLRRLTPEPAQS